MRAKVSVWQSRWGRDRWIALARALGVQITYWIVYFSVGLPVGVGFFIFARGFMDDELREVPTHMEDTLLFLSAIAWLLILVTMLVVVAIMLRWFDRRGSFTEIGFRSGKGTGRRVILSITAAIVLVILIFLVARAAGVVRIVEAAWEERLWSDIFTDLLGYFINLAAIAITSELVFRGYIRFTLSQTFSTQAALVISALLFALSQVVMASSGWLGALNALLAGLILGMLVVLTGSLWVPIAAHFAWIFMESFVFSFPTFGVAPEGLLRMNIVPGLLLDGVYGPQGGMLVLVAFLIVFVGLWLYAGKRIRAETTSTPVV